MLLDVTFYNNLPQNKRICQQFIVVFRPTSANKQTKMFNFQKYDF